MTSTKDVTSKNNLTSDFNVTQVKNNPLPVTPAIESMATANSNANVIGPILMTTEEKLSGGFSMMPNALIMAFISGEIDKSEFQILCLIVRLSIGYQKEFA